MRRSEPEREPATITTGDLTIDLAARPVSVAGEEVRLTPTEFGLLALLARNRGRLMTHRDLLTGVWGPGYEHDTQVLRVHIATPGRKLGGRGGPPTISAPTRASAIGLRHEPGRRSTR